jgi:hypothetical protein
VGAAVAWLVERWAEFAADVGDIGLVPAGGAAALGILGVVVTAEVWRQSVATVAGTMPRSTACRVFWASQVGKYLPGAVWPFMIQGLAARRLAIRSKDMLTGGVVFLAVHMLVGLCLGSVGLALTPGASPLLRGGTWAVTGLYLLLVISGAWRHLPQLIGRPALPSLDRAALWRAVAWMALAWLLYGASTALLVWPLRGGAVVDCIAPALAASTTGWAVGLVVVVAPAGAGARELAMVWTLHGSLPPDGVLAVALVSRAILLVGDLGLSLLGVGVLRSLRSGVTRPTEEAPSVPAV